jgi:hypothetical protein
MTTKRILVIDNCRSCPFWEARYRRELMSHGRRFDWCEHGELKEENMRIDIEELKDCVIPDWCPLKKENE